MFYLRLSLALGMTVQRMLIELDSAELTEYMAFYELDPWGEERADLRAGIIASTYANANRGRNSKPYEARDFMPRFDRQEVKQDVPSQVRAIFGAMSKRGK